MKANLTKSNILVAIKSENENVSLLKLSVYHRSFYMGAGFLCLCLNLKQQAIAKIIAKISNRVEIQISNICHQGNCVSCPWLSCSVDSGGDKKENNHCTMKK